MLPSTQTSLSTLCAGTQDIAAKSSEALEEIANRGGAIVVSAPVYAELLAIPHSKKSELDAFISQAKIRVDWKLSELCWIAAGVAFADYARRRTRQKINVPRRILADFIIGAHSLEIGSLLTADGSFYRMNFPQLRLLEF